MGTYTSTRTIVIDINDSSDASAELIAQITRAVLRDKMWPGDALPSIRQLANDLELDNRTVTMAYRALERDAVIQTTGGRISVHPAQLERILQHGADSGWPRSLLNWMQGTRCQAARGESAAVGNAESSWR